MRSVECNPTGVLQRTTRYEPCNDVQLSIRNSFALSHASPRVVELWTAPIFCAGSALNADVARFYYCRLHQPAGPVVWLNLIRHAPRTRSALISLFTVPLVQTLRLSRAFLINLFYHIFWIECCILCVFSIDPLVLQVYILLLLYISSKCRT